MGFLRFRFELNKKKTALSSLNCCSDGRSGTVHRDYSTQRSAARALASAVPFQPSSLPATVTVVVLQVEREEIDREKQPPSALIQQDRTWMNLPC
mmetsp:Transcript_20162/g.29926  ORF Transcript_20162/g.29926 Transcript_20162/m.29926 type:complete len:95 (-) Transcript_20162:544-828(-)